ncbi:MAG: threonine synthase [Halanaerobiales bacterium]|nr:threonine synthase [Halanaerobiales bacterium]
MEMWRGLIDKYLKYLPVKNINNIVSLYEGNTPLIKANWLSKRYNIELYLKFEGANPTGSFKDRGMTYAVTKAVENKSKAIICASTGNTSASAAAFGARAGLKTIVILPEAKIAKGKLSQAMIYGAEIIPIKDNFDRALEIVRKLTEKYSLTLVNSLNPFRIEGQKTAAFEVADQLGKKKLDILALPVGNAGNITAYWKGFKEYNETEMIDYLPKMYGFQADGSAAMVQNKVIKKPETIATAIRIGKPVNRDKAKIAVNESKGLFHSISDQKIKEMHKILASKEGVFVEPASTTPIAGIINLIENGYNLKHKKIVAVLTGNGLKDQEFVLNNYDLPVGVKGNLKHIENLINLMD